MNIQIKLTNPYVFKYETIPIELNGIIIKPKYLSICKADMKYYKGQRPSEVLEKKLPLCLIHECVGRIVFSDNNKFNVNDNVCVVPISNNMNYHYNKSDFMSSNIDGCLQEYVKIKENHLIKIRELNPEYSTFEMGSVVVQALRRLSNHNINLDGKSIAIIGTGSLSFWVSLIVKEIYDCQVTVIGNNKQKLSKFNFVDNTLLFKDCHQSNKYDIVFECVGYNTDKVYEKILNIINSEGYILNLGVPETNLSFNIRKFMEKGIYLLSSHRSVYADFLFLYHLVECSDFIKNNLKNIVSNIVKYKELEDIYNAFENASNYQFKTIIEMSD